MQTFFVSSLGFDGVLSYADWLCMKCYSKWYNRCKRKASTTVLSSDAAAYALPPIPTPPRRKRSTSSTKQGQATSPVVVIAESKEKEREYERGDIDNDDALLLTRITTHTNPSTPINISIQRDMEGEVDDLRDELHRVKGEVGRLSQELSKRDGQMEEMLKFVKTEIAAMHVLLKEIAEAKWKNNNNNNNNVINSHPPMVNNNNNNLIAIPSPPNVHMQAGSVYIPSNHNEWRTK